MPHDSEGLLPPWFLKKGHFTRSADGRAVPDYADPLFRRATERLVGEMGARYGNHPLLDAVDIGTLGYWGEWHLGLGTKMTDRAGLRWAVDLYFEAFPRTPLMMLIGDVEALAYAVSRGAGWRADCWGDNAYGTWSHMFRRYARNIARAEAVDAWKRGPVSLETCGTMHTWFHKGYGPDYDPAYALDEAARWHASTINNKSSAIPPAWREAVEASQRRLGYRYELREINYPSRVRRGQPWVLDQWWVNSGNAPCYQDYRLRARLEGPAGALELELPHKLSEWLPGDDQCPVERLVVPPGLARGAYELRLGIVRAGGKVPVVLAANQGRTRSGWLRIGSIEVI